jgi:hypothetical protein
VHLRFSICLGNEMKGVLLIAPLDDDISKSTAAERRLLDFSGVVFSLSGIYFALIGAKKYAASLITHSLSHPRTNRLFLAK